MYLPGPHKIDHSFLNRKCHEVYNMFTRTSRKVHQMIESMVMGHFKMRVATEVSFEPVGIQQIIV